MTKEKFTIKDFNKKHSNDDMCLHQIFTSRYGNLENCPECQSKFSFHKISDRKCYACAYCSYQLHPLAGTIFHKSPTNLKKWFFAIFLFSASKNGVSAKELQRQLGVTYKCSYRIGQQIKKLFDENIEKLQNIIEIDEAYCENKENNKHINNKTPNNQDRSNKTKKTIIEKVERS